MTYATLLIYPKRLDPRTITDRLGIEPSGWQRRGEFIQPAHTRIAPIDGWFLTAKGQVESKDSRRPIDGRLDLLVGDFTMQAPDLPEPTPERKVKHEAIRKQLAGIRPRYREKVQKIIGPNRAKTKEELDGVNKELTELRGKMQELRSQLPPESEYQGWVWLFLRKPAETVSGR